MPEKKLLGVTFHFDDKTTQKVGVEALMNWQNYKAGGGKSRGSARYNWVDAEECPEHGRWDVVQAGSNENNSWDAFYSCTNRDCNNRPGRDWVSDGNPAEEYVTAAEMANDDSASEELDDLPF